MCTRDKGVSDQVDRGQITGRTAYDVANEKEKFSEYKDILI